jgi:hypothetical protein
MVELALGNVNLRFRLKNLNSLNILHMKARGLMGEHKRTGQFTFESLAEKSDFLSANTLNINFHITCLHWFSVNSLNICQVDSCFNKLVYPITVRHIVQKMLDLED